MKERVASVQRTLDGIDMEKFWQRVMTRYIPLAEANERMRFLSYKHIVEHPRLLD